MSVRLVVDFFFTRRGYHAKVLILKNYLIDVGVPLEGGRRILRDGDGRRRKQ